MTGHTLAIDLGGTKIDLCRLTDDGRIVWRTQIPTASLEPGHISFLDRVLDFVGAHLADDDDRIGVSWNTAVNKGRITRASLLGGEACIDIGEVFATRFRRPVHVENDVHAMARGEYAFGIGSRYASFVLINMGSGFGIAYHDKVVMRGATGSAGAVWQERYYVPEIGEYLILDRLLSGRGLTHLYRRLSGCDLSGLEIARHVGHDANADAAFAIIGCHLGSFLISVTRLFDAAAIVLTGSVAKSAPHFLPQAIERLKNEVEPGRRPADVLVSRLDVPACLGLLNTP